MLVYSICCINVSYLFNHLFLDSLVISDISLLHTVLEGVRGAVNPVGSGDKLPQVSSQIPCISTAYLWESCLNSLRFSFFICGMSLKIVPEPKPIVIVK